MDLTGKLLAAMPSLQDPRFDHALILICAHSPDGAMGLIVNHPMPDVPFATLTERLGIAHTQGIDLAVHYGGPVEAGRGFILHRDNFSSDAGGMPIAGGYHLSATLDVLESLAAGTGPSPALLTLGYAGWGPNQLETEIAENAWLTLDGRADIIFTAPAGEKWAQALRLSGVDPRALSGAAGHA
ncbi:MAG: YqgE/AlgH family protein [Cypionkella sp.]|nr:YqgE/AlgH family protein [Cypionkella sp.]